MKHLFKLIILWVSSMVHRNHRSKCIYYHDVGTQYTSMGTELETIIKHIGFVRQEGYELVQEITKKDGQIMICFDDGWAGIYKAKDYFVSEHIFPTVFIAVELIGKEGYLSLEQILEMQSLGFIFEGHTWNHKDLTLFDNSGLHHEIVDSKNELSRLLGKEVTALCFPNGRFSDRVYSFSVEAGYKKIYSSITGGYFDLLESRNIICRNLVQNVSDREFCFIIKGTSRFFVRRSMKLHYQK